MIFAIVVHLLSKQYIYIKMPPKKSGFFGEVLGNALGKIGSHFLPIPGVDGGQVGQTIGGFLPFKKGGKVKKITKKDMYKAVLHKSMGGVVRRK
jgi:hypothetical protein